MLTPTLTQEHAREEASFISKVYAWMSLALAITAFVAMFVASSPSLIEAIVGNRIIFIGLLIGELLLVVFISGIIGKISGATATFLFVVYAVLNGITLSFIFLLYTSSSIASTFFVTAGTFAGMSLYGYTTKRDLTSWGNLLMMALLGVVIASVVNMFFNNAIVYWVTTYIGIIVFVGLIAYDTQKLKAVNTSGIEGTDIERKGAIMGALMLYLDFINLFLLLLRLFGRRK